MDEQLKTREHARQTAIDPATQFGPKLLVGLLILAAGFYLGSGIGKLMNVMLAGVSVAGAGIAVAMPAMLETFRARGISIPFSQHEGRLLGQP